MNTYINRNASLPELMPNLGKEDILNRGVGLGREGQGLDLGRGQGLGRKEDLVQVPEGVAHVQRRDPGLRNRGLGPGRAVGGHRPTRTRKSG